MANETEIREIAGRLRLARERRGIASAAEAARRFGWTASTYQGHENANRGIPRSKLVDYARAFRVSPNWLLTGRDESAPVEISRGAPVVGDVAAGVWREEDVWDTGKYPDIPAIPGRYAALRQVAYRVSGPSMDKLRIFDDDFVVCVPYWEARSSPVDDDIVVVTRRRGSLVERTVKQISVGQDAVTLWPRSTDVRFQEPLVVQVDGDGLDDNSIEITGLVIGTFRHL